MRSMVSKCILFLAVACLASSIPAVGAPGIADGDVHAPVVPAWSGPAVPSAAAKKTVSEPFGDFPNGTAPCLASISAGGAQFADGNDVQAPANPAWPNPAAARAAANVQVDPSDHLATTNTVCTGTCSAIEVSGGGLTANGADWGPDPK